MKKSLGIAAGIFAVSIVLAAETLAQPKIATRNINQRQRAQAERIRSGISSGELTARETARLAREQVQIRRMEARFRSSGGGLSGRERVRLHSELNQSSRHIYRQKHDAQSYPRQRRP